MTKGTKPEFYYYTCGDRVSQKYISRFSVYKTACSYITLRVTNNSIQVSLLLKHITSTLYTLHITSAFYSDIGIKTSHYIFRSFSKKKIHFWIFLAFFISSIVGNISLTSSMSDSKSLAASFWCKIH